MSTTVDRSVGDAPAPVAPRLPAPLVGRDDQIARLEETWSSVRHGSGRLVLLEGIAGSGKTRLVDSFLAAASNGGALVLTAACVPDDPVPFGPLRRAVDDALRADADVLADRMRDAAGPFAGALARFTPRLAAALGDRPDALLGSATPDLVVDGIAELLLRLPAGRQTVLALDDMQWLDAASRRVLRAVLARLAEAPLLVLCAGRDDASALGDGVDPRALTRIALDASSVDQVTALIESHHLQRGIGDLGERAKAILTTAAVIGARVPLSLLRAAVPDGPGVVRSTIDEAVVLQLVEWCDADVFAFTHDRVRTTLLSALDAAALQAEHQQVADALEGSGDFYALARHYARGDVARYPRRVHETNLVAGSAALADAAPDEAHAFLDDAARAAALAGLTPDPTLHRGFADACAGMGRVDEAALHLESALATTTSGVARARICARLAELQLAGPARDVASARRHLERGYREIATAMPDGGIVELALAAGQGAIAALASRLPMIGWLLPANGDTDTVCATLDRHRGKLAAAEASPTVRLQLGLRAAYAAVRSSRSVEQSRSYAQVADLLGALGLTRAGRRVGDLAVEVAQSVGDRIAVASSRAARAITLNAVGETLESEREHRRVFEAYEAWLPADDRLAAATDLAWNLWSRGRDRDALAVVEQGLRRALPLRSTNDRAATDPMLAVVGHLVAWQGATHEARDTVARCAAAVAAAGAPRFDLAMLACARASLLLTEHDLGASFDALVAEHRGLGLDAMTEPLHTRLFHVYRAYACLQRCMRAKPAERSACLVALEAAFAVLRRAAHVPVLRCHRLVIEGSMRRLAGRAAEAAHALAAAEELAAEVDAPWAVFEIFRQRAYLLAARGRGEIAGRYAAMARDVALRQGWAVRAQWIETEFPSAARVARPTNN